MGVAGKQLKDRLLKAIRHNVHSDPLNDHIDITVTSEGRIQLLEGTSSTFFAKGCQAHRTEPGDSNQARARIEEPPEKVTIERHTDAKPCARLGDDCHREVSATAATPRPPHANGLGANDICVAHRSDFGKAVWPISQSLPCHFPKMPFESG